MTESWRFHPAAADELREAALWYDSRRDGLGDDFLVAVESAIASILDPRVSWGRAPVQGSQPVVFRRSVRGFPVDLFFIDHEGEVVIVAVAHERRRPGYWAERLNGDPDGR